MDLSKLEEGKTYKNYKELCEALGEKYKAGKSKQLQLEDFKRFFESHREGYKFIIDKIYEHPEFKIPSNRYIEIIKALILDLIILSEEDKVIRFSKNELLKKLEMVNYNYFYAKDKQNRLSRYIYIPINEVNDFYTTSDNFFKYTLEKALNDLEDQAIFTYEKVNNVAIAKAITYENEKSEIIVRQNRKTDKFGDQVSDYVPSVQTIMEYRAATIDEENLITKTTNDALKRYEFEKVSQVLKAGKGADFFNEVNKTLLEKANIAFFYKAYKIVFKRDNILKIREDMIKKLKINDYRQRKQKLNQEISTKIKTNAKRRHEQALKAFGGRKMRMDKRQMRSSKNYIKDQFALTNLLIDHETEYITLELENYYRKFKQLEKV